MPNDVQDRCAPDGDRVSGSQTELTRALGRLSIAEASGSEPAVTAARLAVHAGLLAQDLVIPQTTAAAPGMLAPQIRLLSSGPAVLAFDSEERLADLAPEGADFVALSGRDLLQAMAAQDASEAALGLGLNLATPAAAFLLDGAGVRALAQLCLAPPPPPLDPQALSGIGMHAPDTRSGIDPALLGGLLEQALGRHPGLADTARLAQMEAMPGLPPLLVLALWNAGTDQAVTPKFEAIRDLTEAARLVALEAEAGGLGLAVVAPLPASPLARTFAEVGHRIAVHSPAPPRAEAQPTAPGMNPEKPPRLK